ncbi:MAG: DUF2238 domain-containing protein [Gammaproteobacteria bacterium]|nr:DUF2238 domain-containing protein [Gammaproteobacteria bacterium]MCP5136159.1 DUF2238 domain-containing protein [Gammaproteobacteria bacterium]
MKWAWLGLFSGVLLWSGIAPFDRMTWALEVAPAIVGLGLIIVSYRRFLLTPLLYWLILAHAVVLMIGGHYTYALVPIGDWFSHLFDLERNNYDKLGHFMQGFVPAILAREILIRQGVVSTPGWRNFLIVSICLAFSAFYELIEWWVALVSGEAAEAFLGTQGDIWDTQSDMGMALVGAISALMLLGTFHDRQLDRLSRAP